MYGIFMSHGYDMYVAGITRTSYVSCMLLPLCCMHGCLYRMHITCVMLLRACSVHHTYMERIHAACPHAAYMCDCRHAAVMQLTCSKKKTQPPNVNPQCGGCDLGLVLRVNNARQPAVAHRVLSPVVAEAHARAALLRLLAAERQRMPARAVDRFH